jgi:hypothetical protein
MVKVTISINDCESEREEEQTREEGQERKAGSPGRSYVL